MQADGPALKKPLEEFKALSREEAFSKISKSNVDIEYLRNHTDEGNATFTKRPSTAMRSLWPAYPMSGRGEDLSTSFRPPVSMTISVPALPAGSTWPST